MKKVSIISMLFLVVLLTACNKESAQSNQNIKPSTPEYLKIDNEGSTEIDAKVLRGALGEANGVKLSELEIEGIKYMMEEEKLARDVYIRLYEKWGKMNFSNISRSEGTHIDAVQTLSQKYGIETEFYNDKTGTFFNPDLAKLYDGLVGQGDQSLVEALRVGALIEEIDIVDLEKYLAQTSNEDIALVYNNLMRGSRNHLRSFVKVLTAQGETYAPQHLDESSYNAIVNSAVERGNSAQGKNR